MNANRPTRFKPVYQYPPVPPDRNKSNSKSGPAQIPLTKQEEAVSALIMLYVSAFPPSAAKILMSHIVDPLKLSGGATASDVDREQLAALVDIAVGDYLDIIEEEMEGEESFDNSLLSDSDIMLINDIRNISGEEFVKIAGNNFFQNILGIASKIYQS